jgi:sec-independent protein translocase protein TatA
LSSQHHVSDAAFAHSVNPWLSAAIEDGYTPPWFAEHPRPVGRARHEEERAMPSLGWQELMIVLVIVIIIFGAGKLPEIGGAMGKSIKEFKRASDDETGALPKDSTTPRRDEGAKVVESREVRADEI